MNLLSVALGALGAPAEPAAFEAVPAELAVAPAVPSDAPAVPPDAPAAPAPPPPSPLLALACELLELHATMPVQAVNSVNKEERKAMRSRKR